MSTNYNITTLQATAIVVVVVWDLFWKIKAMWRAAEKKQLGWFIILLLINSVGILPILYLLYSKPDRKD